MIAQAFDCRWGHLNESLKYALICPYEQWHSGLVGSRPALSPSSPPGRRPGHPLDSRGRGASWAVPLGLGDWAPRLRPRSRVALLG